MRSLIFSIFVLFLSQIIIAQNYEILESNSKSIKLKVTFNNKPRIIDTTFGDKKLQFIRSDLSSSSEPGEPFLPNYSVNLGIKANSSPTVKILTVEKKQSSNKLIMPFPETHSKDVSIDDLTFDQIVYSKNRLFPKKTAAIGEAFNFRESLIAPVIFNPYQYNPVTRELFFNYKIVVKISYNNQHDISGVQKKIEDEFTYRYISKNVINPGKALNWASENETVRTENYWYDPNKSYLKIFVKEKDVYKVTHRDLISNGLIPGGEVNPENIRVYNGNKQVPIEVITSEPEFFTEGDYLRFVGYPPKPTPHCKMNIYNNENVYFITTGGGNDNPLRYNLADGTPGEYDNNWKNVISTIHYEEDKQYERLGYAKNDKRDYWYWQEITYYNQNPQDVFKLYFNQFPNRGQLDYHITVRVNLHGLKSTVCSDDHNATIELNNYMLGNISWDNQTEATFEKTFLNSQDSVQIYSSGNILKVFMNDQSCNSTANGLVNWIEFDYWKSLRADTNHVFFKSPPSSQSINRYQLWNWTYGDAKIFIPGKNKLINNYNETEDQWNTIFFADTVSEETEYFFVSDDYGSEPVRFENVRESNLRSESNQADYIIITHPDFEQAANRLAKYRKNNLPHIDNPSVSVVNINDIYKEFSGGMLEPKSIRDFLSYAYHHWQSPAPAYVVLMGDVSYDYRQILPDSRKNYIPAIPYHAISYGQAVSDNNFVAVSGNDLIPDMMIGRISCETLEEANNIVDKTIGYPETNEKKWKEEVLLISSGLNAEDENTFGFNDDNLLLTDSIVTPNGYSANNIFRYVNEPRHEPYKGGEIDIREKIDEGVSLVNYYGHGASYQWDLIFFNEDVYLLNNVNKLPVISSVSCYTAHIDNQTPLGEVFTRVPGKGAVGFWGSTAVTYYSKGKALNSVFFDSVIDDENYVVGEAILDSKIRFASQNSGSVGVDYLALSMYLGDPAVTIPLPQKPDFYISSSDIKVSPQNIVLGDSVDIRVKLHNLGRNFNNDSVTASILAEVDDTSIIVKENKISSFGQLDSISTVFEPNHDGLINVKVEINEKNIIEEIDYSDNTAQSSFTVYNLNEPNIIKPINGLFTSSNSVKFLFSDIGYNLGKNLTYFIEIDTSKNFENPIVESNSIVPEHAVAEYNTPELSEGYYFWRTRLFDGEQYSNWTNVRNFTISDEPGFGYLAESEHLTLFQNENFNFSNSSKNLQLDTTLHPPKPNDNRLKDTIVVDKPSDSFNMTTLTTDNQYLYYGNKAYFNNQQPSKIYKIGTGINSAKGHNYGAIPNFSAEINQSIFYLDGFIYVPYGDPFTLLKVNPETGDTTTVALPNGMLDANTGRVKEGSFYLATDGKYVYNIAFQDSTGTTENFVIRFFDPDNGWSNYREDLITQSAGWGSAFSGFFIAAGYVYPYEDFSSGYMRRIRLSDGSYREQWLTNSAEVGYQGYHAWAYDEQHDVVYASIFRGDADTTIHVFEGHYTESNGKITTPVVGPASKWENLQFDLQDDGYLGESSNYLHGYNNLTKNWDTLEADINSNYDLSSIDSTVYKELKMTFNFEKSATGVSSPPKFSKFKVVYESLPEIILTANNLSFVPDSLMQGFDIDIDFKAENIGHTKAENTLVEFWLNDADSALFSKRIDILPDSSVTLSTTRNTSGLLFFNNVSVNAEYPKDEFYSYNNSAEDSFYVARDSSKPKFDITFNGKEIIDGDIISANPTVEMSLQDNSPLPLDSSNFFIYHTLNGNSVDLVPENLDYSYTEYPNSKATMVWEPHLDNGTHTLEVLAKDASGNYFDTTNYSISFRVNTEDDIKEVYNYPNPFESETYFTFNLTGSNLPDEFTIKVYTIAGRLIRKMNIPPGELQFGFNKIRWDGRDQDGNSIANGVYFYKITVLNKTEKITEIKKMAKLQ